MLFEHWLKLENTSNEPWDLQYVTESIAHQTDYFANVFVRENIAYGYDFVTL